MIAAHLHRSAEKTRRAGRGSVQRRAVRAMLADVQGGRCLLCGNALVDPTLEHMIPIGRGGSNRLKNVALSCRTCNDERGVALLTRAQMDRAVAWFWRPDMDARLKAMRTGGYVLRELRRGQSPSPSTAPATTP